MGAAKKLIDKKVLRDLVPINALSAVHLEEISRKAIIEEVRSGRYVFKKDDRDCQSVYLLEGNVELIGDDRESVGTIKGGTEAARHPLAHKQPRQVSVRADGPVTVARIDSSLLDVLLTWDESAGYDVAEIGTEDDNDDWMTRMLQSQAFLQLPPSNIHQLLMRLEDVTVKAGDTVVRQGDEGDYFYIVKSGRLAVSRKASARSKEVLLAELGEGACFGEEALVSGTKRNASVTMITDGALMRLSKEDFSELLCAPLVHEVDFADASDKVAAGAVWLDVRLPGEFQNQSIKGSTNLPLSAVREHASELDSELTYILCCDTGRRSAAGAFVLSQRGFDVYTLRNGLMDVPNDALNQPQLAAAEPRGSRDAEIIPFESDKKPSADDADTARQASPPADEGGASQDRIGQLERQLTEARTQLDEALSQRAQQQSQADAASQRADQLEQQLQQAQQELASQQAAADRNRDQGESLQQDNQALRDELARLQQTLGQIRESADGRDDALQKELQQMADRLEKERQAQEKLRSELEQELGKVREDYQQLGQRTSALAGERDALTRELDSVRQNSESLRAQLGTQQEEKDRKLQDMERQLEQQQEELRAAGDRGQVLETELEELRASQAALQGQLDSAGGEVAQLAGEKQQLESSLARHQDKITDLEQLLQQAGEREVGLQRQHEEVDEALRAARSQSEDERRDLDRKLASLESELEAYRNEKQELVQRLDEASAAVREAEENGGDITGKLRSAERRLEQAEQELERARQDGEAAASQLNDAQQALKASQQDADDLRKKLATVESEHASDINSVRGALSRAQDERDNVMRDQSRLMESLRKAEQNLQRVRDDHDIEIRRLRKELEASAGESSAGLAAELEAVQQQLSDGARLRDDLEVQLGQRSAQLENAQADVTRLQQQLDLAKDSARQAEQQLVEANQAANEEMRVRIEAEQNTQQELRKQLETVTSERNANREQLTVLQQQIDDLEASLRESRAETKRASGDSERAVQQSQQELESLREALQRAEQEREAAQQAEQQARAETDQLRAEAEVTRGLIDMQGDRGESDQSAREELEQVKKNVEIAVRLRAQAEQQAAGLQREVEQLHEQLAALRSDEGLEVEPAQIPSLDAGDPHAGTVMQGGFEPDAFADQDGDGEEEAAQPVLLDADAGEAPPESKSGSKAGWLLGVLLLGGVAGGAYWWTSLGPGGAFDKAVPALPPASDAAEMPAPPAGMDEPETTDADAKREPATPVARQPAELVEPRPTPGTRPQPVTKVTAEPVVPERRQPARTFRDPLSVGGSAPTMVELHADSFQMGSSAMSQNFDERPRHTVKLSAFAISRHEVTFEQYDRFAADTGRSRPSDEGWGRGKRPVVNVSRSDAIAYTRWLSQQTGRKYRLPTEAEWEFAARSGSTSRYWWGNSAGQGNANCFDCGSEWSGRLTAPVGSFAASDYGLHDMAGNVREWVQDCYQANYDGAPADGRAVTSGDCSGFVVRGGSFSSTSNTVRSASREQYSADTRLDDLGFRVVREP